MKTWSEALRDAMLSGSIASVASTAVLSACGKRDARAPLAPTNAISHWLWGDRAMAQDDASGRYTGIGYAIHHASSTLWAVFYEKWFGARAERREAGAALGGGMVVAALACFVDYKLTPKRLQPGFEQHLSMRSMALVYATFGASLVLRGWMTPRENSRHGAYVDG